MANTLFILASSSPRRLELLNKIGVIPSEVIPADIDESVIKGERPTEYVKRVALAKAFKVAENIANKENLYILSADTIVVKGLRILGKPVDSKQEESFLKLLSGGNHKVLTAFCILRYQNNTVKKILKVVQSSVSVKLLNTQEINKYIAGGEWEGKSGGYSIQGNFEMFVKSINGSISNIVGLPILQVYNSLFGLGYYNKEN